MLGMFNILPYLNNRKLISKTTLNITLRINHYVDSVRIYLTQGGETMRQQEFAHRILKALEKLPNDDSKKLNRLYYLESQLTIKELTKILNQFSQLEEEITSDEQLKLFYELLEKRRERFIPNSTNPKTKADRICEYLANELCKQANTRHYKARDPNHLLKPTQQDGHGMDPETHLKQMLLSDVTNRDKLITTLLILDKSDWVTYCDHFELTMLIKLASHDQSTIEDVLNVQDANQQDEEYQCASSFCKGYIYLMDRIQGPQFTSYTGALLSLFKKIPNMTDKIDGARELLKFLTSGISLYDFCHHLDDPAGDLYCYRDALHDSRLQKITEEIKNFIQAHPRSDSSHSSALLMQAIA